MPPKKRIKIWSPSDCFLENAKYFEAKARRMKALAKIINQCDDEDLAIIKRNLEDVKE